jgi:hypothetical protein
MFKIWGIPWRKIDRSIEYLLVPCNCKCKLSSALKTDALRPNAD